MGAFVSRLSSVELDDLLATAKADSDNDSDAMNEIVRRLLPMARGIARRVTSCREIHEDLVSVALLSVIGCVRRHDPQYDGFIAYVRIAMTGAARREAQRLLTANVIGMSGEVLSYLETQRGFFETSHYFDQELWGVGPTALAVTSLKSSQQQLLSQVYVCGISLTEIALVDRTGVSAVSQRLKVSHRMLRERLTGESCE
jgi:RNA polymerase sigma factor (sigma-70 family)